ncbi:hypothetical protein BS17DRAFT_793094 [Gyrodon lividus]|nr:hypothetical protein BS17DRAFT_793094 [Gyrodon lividus]
MIYAVNRYHSTPTFGRGTIHRFSQNASAMKWLAACDFEDLLQCAIPVFEGLLPDSAHAHNKMNQVLLFDLATWHAYAKLCLHTDNTLLFFDVAAIELGKTIRKFISTTLTARGHHKALIAGKNSKAAHAPEAILSFSWAKIKKLNLSMYKYHALGDYPNTI